MRYTSLGRTGIELSRYGLGSYIYAPGSSGASGSGVWRLSGRPPRGDVTYDEHRAIIERALALGVTLFDCDAERELEILGRIFHDLRCRERIVLSAWLRHCPLSEEAADADELTREVDRALRLLRTEMLDVLVVCAPGALAEGDYPRRLADTCDALVAKGRIRCAAPYSPDGVRALGPYINTGGFAAVVVTLGLMNPSPVTSGIVEAAAKQEMGVIAVQPFQRGWVFRCADEIGWGAGDRLADVASASLHWTLDQPGVCATATGVSGLDELERNAAAPDQPYGPRDASLLRKLVATEAYGEFIALSREKDLPDIHDWRDDLDALNTPE